MCEFLVSLFVENCVNCCYEYFDYIFERYQEMPPVCTQHPHKPPLHPAFVVGFSESKLGIQKRNKIPTVGCAMVPFIVGVVRHRIGAEELQEKEHELLLIMQRALDYQEECLSNESKVKAVVGISLSCSGLFTFYTMTKNNERFEFCHLKSCKTSLLFFALTAAQIICNTKKLAELILTPPSPPPSPSSPLPSPFSPPTTHPSADLTLSSLPIVVNQFLNSSNNQYILSDTPFYEKESVKIYKGINTTTGEEVVLKTKAWHDYPQKPSEIEVLTQLGGKDHTCRLVDHFGTTNNAEWENKKIYTCVFEYVKHRNPSTKEELKRYMQHLFQALSLCKKHGIIHRDVKTDNILMNTDSGETTLIDFESAIFIGQAKYMYSGTEGHYPPELDESGGLCNFSFAGDIWSAGVVFVELMLNTAPTTCDVDSDGDIDPKWILKALIRAKVAYKNAPDAFLLQHPLFSEDGLDLAEELLVLNRWKRPSAREALGHPFFY
eukprot:Phypoly_transcript_05419.p1 GENE.Phypoly_transcript_05419~~Phypoly_transcript_05419.p1  ORF type:complete len:492 (+),score=83.86 Phypoly_transcript_05419:435-1910(+)